MIDKILEIAIMVLGVAFWFFLIPYVYRRWRERTDTYQTKTDELIAKYRSREDDHDE